jgi:predicted nucleic acid-binding protein
MSDRTFIDTNVLIYAHDVDAEAKHEAAKNILRGLWSERAGVLSPQVLQEFYVNVRKKIPHPLSKESARLVVSTYAIWCVDTNRLKSRLHFESRTSRGLVSGTLSLLPRLSRAELTAFCQKI